MKQSRRKFIEKAVLASIGFTLFNNCRKPDPIEKQNGSIIVVGAGISGLTAAYNLSKKGYDVTILEANKRIGGRILSVDFGGMKADLGASWIHGSINNPLYDFVKKHNINTIPTKEEPSYIFDLDGEDITSDEWNVWTKFLNKLVNESYNYPNISLENLIQKFWDDEVLSPKLERVFNGGIRLELEIPYSEDSKKLAANVLQNDGYYKGKHVILPTGMSSIIDILALNENIKLNTFATKIDYSGDKIFVHTTELPENEKYRSCNACHSNQNANHLNSNSVYKADRVLITVPVNILKNEGITFEPELPIAKKKTIQNIQVGTMNKVYMKFDNAFWPSDSRFFSKLKENRSEIIEFMNMQVINQKPILIAFLGGYHSKRIESFSENQLINYMQNELKDIFNIEIPIPTELKRTKWHTSPYSLGSYPVIPPGFDNHLFTEMAKPVANKLFFAGDATEKIHYASAHGAFKSGLRAFNEIQNSFF